MIKKTRELFFVLIGLFIVLVVFFFPILFQDKILLPLDQLNSMTLPYSANYDKVEVYNHFLFDAITQYFPYKVLTQENLRQGNLFFWNSFIYGGYPQYAETMGGHFDITNFVLFFIDMPGGYHWQIILQFLIAGIGMYLLLRIYQVIPLIAFTFALAFMVNSMFISTVFHRWILASFCWVPYIILSSYYYHTQKSNLTFIICGIFLSFAFMGGSFQTAIYVIFIFLLFNLLFLFEIRENNKVRILILLFAGLILGFMLSAIMWLPSLELFWQDLIDGSVRANGIHKHYSLLQRLLSFPLLISFFIPELVGNVRAFDLTKIAGASIGDFNGFIGFAPLLLGLWSMFFLWNKNRNIRVFSVIAICGILLPLITPLYKFLYHRFFIIYIFGINVTGAIGFNELLIKFDPLKLKKFRKWLKILSFILGFIFLLIILLNIIMYLCYDDLFLWVNSFITLNLTKGQLSAGNEGWMLQRINNLFEHYSIFSSTMFLPLLFIACQLIIFFHIPSNKSRFNKFIVTILIFTFLELFLYARAWLPMLDTGKYPYYPQTKVIDIIKRDKDNFRVLPISDKNSQRVFQPNILSMYNISTLSGYESIKPQTISDLINLSINNSIFPDILGLLNVKYLITSSNNKLKNSSFTLLDSTNVNLYQNHKWSPRAFMVYNFEISKYKELTSDFVQKLSKKPHTVYFEKLPSQIIQYDNELFFNKVKLVVDDNNYIRIKIFTEKEGYLILSDNYYPGWKAFVNGHNTPILKANYIMRCVTVPKGESIVEFRFEPYSFSVGYFISLYSLLICTIFIFMSILQKRYIQRSE